MRCLLAKVFNNRSYAEGFLEGKLYINPLASFGIGNLINPRKDMDNDYRGDLNEGTKTVHPGNCGGHGFFDSINGLPEKIEVVGDIDSQFLFEHVMSLFAIRYDEQREAYIKPDKRMKDFDDGNEGATVIISNPREFLVRLFATLSHNMASLFWAGYGVVRYVPKDGVFGERDEFTKTDDYSWQNEFRIAIDVGMSAFLAKSECIGYDSQNDALRVDIGDISDIAFMVTTDQFVNLDFSESVFQTPPKPIIPFYPPVKNRTSFSYPVFNWNNTLHVSPMALYPIKRAANQYRINNYFINKVAEMATLDDDYLKIAHMYFSRLLDLCKCPFDQEEIEALLSAIMHYMRILGIGKLAGITLEIKDGGIQAQYHNMALGDLSLMEVDWMYCKYTRSNGAWKPSAFAEIAALCDDDEFEEYEYQGRRYCRVVVNQDAVLSTGQHVKKGEPVWIEVSKIHWLAVQE